MCFSVLPTHFDVGIFSVTQCVGVTQFFSRFLSREMDPCEIVYSVNLWEEEEGERLQQFLQAASAVEAEANQKD